MSICIHSLLYTQACLRSGCAYTLHDHTYACTSAARQQNNETTKQVRHIHHITHKQHIHMHFKTHLQTVHDARHTYTCASECRCRQNANGHTPPKQILIWLVTCEGCT